MPLCVGDKDFADDGIIYYIHIAYMAPVELATNLPVAYIKENSSENHFTYVSDIRLVNIRARIFRAIQFRFVCVSTKVRTHCMQNYIYNLHNIPISYI